MKGLIDLQNDETGLWEVDGDIYQKEELGGFMLQFDLFVNSARFVLFFFL